MKTVKLGSPEAITERLKAVDNNSHYIERLYPKIVRVNPELAAVGLVLHLQLAICDYTEDLPPVVHMLTNMRIPDFIDALCPDKGVATEAKGIWEEIKGIWEEINAVERTLGEDDDDGDDGDE